MAPQRAPVTPSLRGAPKRSQVRPDRVDAHPELHGKFLGSLPRTDEERDGDLPASLSDGIASGFGAELSEPSGGVGGVDGGAAGGAADHVPAFIAALGVAWKEEDSVSPLR